MRVQQKISIPITPRLDYSCSLLDDIISEVRKEHKKTQIQNKKQFDSGDYLDSVGQKALDSERRLAMAHESLVIIRHKIKNVKMITEIAYTGAPLIHVIRSTSAQLYEIVPSASQRLCELSLYLGSIVVDSATLTGARFDFGQSNLESQSMLDEVKLIVDSKFSKLYPNVDFQAGFNV